MCRKSTGLKFSSALACYAHGYFNSDQYFSVAYVNLGAALITAGRCQEAVSVLRQGSRLDGTGLRDRREHESARVSALLQLGGLYSDQGRLQRALAAYREAAHSLPKHYPPQVSLLLLLFFGKIDGFVGPVSPNTNR